MTRQAIIDRTVNVINKLPEDKALEISDFADFIVNRFEENKLATAIQQMVSNGDSFKFLEQEEEVYSTNDLKVVYNA